MMREAWQASGIASDARPETVRQSDVPNRR